MHARQACKSYLILYPVPEVAVKVSLMIIQDFPPQFLGHG